MTKEEALSKDVYIINENNKIEEVNLYELIMDNIDETTTPNGVGPRFFIEDIFKYEYEKEEKALQTQIDDYLEEVGDNYKNEKEAEACAINEFSYSSFYLEDMGCYYTFKEMKKYGIKKMYVISSWGVGGSNYEMGNEYYSSREKIDEVFFKNVYEFDFMKSNNSNYFEDKDEAIESLQNMQ